MLVRVIRSCSRGMLAVAVGLVAAAVGLGLAAGPADASQVSVRVLCNKAGCGDNLDFRAAPGETNIVTAADRPVLPSGQTVAAFTISDMGAPLHAGSGCSSTDPHTATCSIPAADSVVGLAFDLGDGNDRLDARGVVEKVAANGGPGDDVLLTGPGDDTLMGGGGHDFLDGGGGVNTADFRDARTPVRVDLQAPGPQGTVGSQDTLRNIQSVDAASTSHDVLRGNASDNFLRGGPYALIDGRAGNDDLAGGPGSRLIGGTGNDLLQGSNQDAPLRPGVRISCGPGFDEVGATLIDTVTADCEHVEPDGGSSNAFVHLVSRPGPRRPFAAWRTGCYEDPPASCDTIISAHADSPHGPLLALRRIHQRAPRGGVTPDNYSLFLSPAGRRLLRQRHRITVSLVEHIAPYRDRHHPYVPPLLGVRFVLRG